MHIIVTIVFCLITTTLEVTANSADDESVHILPLEVVKANPFAELGLEIEGRLTLLNGMTEGPFDDCYIVSVYQDSPADIAKIALGDRITAINDRYITEFPLRDFKKLFFSSERGNTIKMTLYDRVSSSLRDANLTLVANNKWKRTDGLATSVVWGVFVAGNRSLCFKLHDIKREATAGSVVDKKQRLKKIYRRIASIEHGKKTLWFIDRGEGTVELIIGNKIPNTDQIAGTLLTKGTTVKLHADGSLGIEEPSVAAPKNGPN